MPADCKLYLTYRTEYLVLGDLCIGVRDRRSSAWLPLHAASCAQLLGALGSRDDSVLLSGTRVRVGERMCMHVSPRRLITGPVVAVEQPTGKLLQHAEEQWRALFAPSDARHSSIVLVTEPSVPDAITSPKNR